MLNSSYFCWIGCYSFFGPFDPRIYCFGDAHQMGAFIVSPEPRGPVRTRYGIDRAQDVIFWGQLWLKFQFHEGP